MFEKNYFQNKYRVFVYNLRFNIIYNLTIEQSRLFVNCFIIMLVLLLFSTELVMINQNFKNHNKHRDSILCLKVTF